MQINKSLFPVGGAYQSINKLNEAVAKLQVQLATQQKASTLSELGSDRVFDLTLRERLSRLDAFSTNIDTTNLRLDFLDHSVTRLNEIEADTRGDLSASGIGSNGINIASASETAYNRLDEILTILNGDLNGRHMFGGNVTDAKPVVSADYLLNGDATHAGLKQLISERKRADFGGITALGDAQNGHGRINIDKIQLSSAIPGPALNEVVVSESATPNGPVVSGITATTADPLSVGVSPAGGTPAPATITFAGAPNLIQNGDQITVNVDQPDGTTEPFVFTAVDTLTVPAVAGEFQIVAGDENATATNFQAAFQQAFHANSVTVAEDGVHDFGIKLGGISTASSDMTVFAQTTTQPHVLQIRVDSLPQIGDTLTISYTLPDGATGSFDVTATTTSPPERGSFLIGADADATATNIGAAITTQLDYVRDTELAAVSANLATNSLINTKGETAMRVDGTGGFDTATSMTAIDPNTAVTWYTGQTTTGSARRTAASRVDESTIAYYGVLANEQGIANLVRANAVMAAETFSADTSAGSDRYQATAQRQVNRLAESSNGTSGSLDVIALELGLSRATVGSASERQKIYGSQLDTMLGDIESVDLNEVAMQLLAVRTNLQASYQTMASLSQLRLVNFM